MARVVLVGLLYVICELYLNDILLYASNEEDVLNNLRKVFERCRQYNITVNPKKCKFGLAEVEYVGHTINSHGISFTQEKILKCIALRKPSNVGELQTFLGFANYFRDHIANHSIMAKPLHDLTTRGASSKHPILWNDTAEDSYDKLITAIKNCPTLYFLQDGAEVFLHTDASDYGIGAYLFQRKDSRDYPAAFVSKALIKAQLRWSTHEKEAYAIYSAFMRLD